MPSSYRRTASSRSSAGSSSLSAIASKRSSALSRETSGSAIALDSLHHGAGAPVAHANTYVLARPERRDRRADVSVRSLDDRVAATEDRKRRQGSETALRRDGTLPPEGNGARDRAVEHAARLVDPLPPYRQAHRWRAPVEHPPRGLEPPAPFIDPLAHATGDAPPGSRGAHLLGA